MVLAIFKECIWCVRIEFYARVRTNTYIRAVILHKTNFILICDIAPNLF